MPFIGRDGLPVWRVTLTLARETRPSEDLIWERPNNGNDVNLTLTGTLGAAWERVGNDINLLSTPTSEANWGVIGTDINLGTP